LEWEQQHSPNFCAHYENRKDYLTAVFARLLSTRYSDRERVVSYTLAERLIDEGVDPAAPYEGGFPIAYLTVVHNERDQYIIPLLIERGAPVDAFNKDGETALYCAVYAKNLALADFLLKKGADINQQNKEDGQTALMVARSEEMMRFLLERGANPNLQDDRRRTVLMEYWIKREFINLLFQYGADPAIKDKDGRTVMFIWSWEDLDGAMIDELISRGCPINEPDNRGLTPLIYAADTASSGSKPQEFIITLLEKGADPNYRDLKGRTALHIYLLGIERWFRKDDKDLPVITALLEAGTRPADKDDDGDSALTTALRLPGMDRKMAHIRKLVRQYADAEDIKIAAAAARKEKKEDTREMLSEYLPPTIGALSVPLILGGLSFLMREVAYKDNPSGNIMGPVNAVLTLGTGGAFMGLLMGGGVGGGGLGALPQALIGGLLGGVAGIIVACMPSVNTAFNNNPVLYYTPTIISAIIASVVIFDIWF
jgi:ankyrin repeat protein